MGLHKAGVPASEGDPRSSPPRSLSPAGVQVSSVASP